MNASLIAKQFDVSGRLVAVEPFGSGNINDTYRVTFRTTFSEERFILQRVRRNVFPHPEYIMENMRKITASPFTFLTSFVVEPAPTPNTVWASDIINTL